MKVLTFTKNHVIIEFKKIKLELSKNNGEINMNANEKHLSLVKSNSKKANQYRYFLAELAKRVGQVIDASELSNIAFDMEMEFNEGVYIGSFMKIAKEMTPPIIDESGKVGLRNFVKADEMATVIKMVLPKDLLGIDVNVMNYSKEIMSALFLSPAKFYSLISATIKAGLIGQGTTSVYSGQYIIVN